MRAFKQKVTVHGGHQLEIRLPEDFPPGPAEVIVLSSLSGKEKGSQQLWTRLEEPHPTLGKIVFYEDPSLPLHPEDWPEDQSL